MTKTKTTMGLEKNKYKNLTRQIFSEDIEEESKSFKNKLLVSLGGASTIFENYVTKQISNCNAICIENNRKTAKLAQKNMNRFCSLIVGDWNTSIRSIKEKINFAWFDSCNVPSLEAVNTCVDDINELRPRVYIATLFLVGRRGERSGVDNMKEDLLGYEARKTLNKKTSGNTSFGMIQAISRYVAKTTGYIPKRVIYYPGGKGEKRPPSIPMVSIIYVLKEEYKAHGKRFSWNNPVGFAGTQFINLFNVKKGITTLEQEKLASQSL